MKKDLLFTSLLWVFLFILPHKMFADTVIYCQSDTLKVWYYYNGIYFNEDADIKNGDTLFIGSNAVFALLEVASQNPEIVVSLKLNGICDIQTCDVQNNVFEISEEGRYFAYESSTGPPITDFYVIKGDSIKIACPFIVPQAYQSPSYVIKVSDDYETYVWSTGANTNSIQVTQPGTYTLQAMNHCSENFENTFIFDEAAFDDDQFYAGKTNGEEIEYIDFDPDSVSYINTGGDDHFYFDLTGDGLTDLVIYVSFSWSNLAYSHELIALPQNGCKIAVDGTNQTALFLQQEQIINNYNIYSGEPEVVLKQYYNSPLGSCSAGSWGSDGYFAYMIPGVTDTIFGWMHILRTLTGTSSEMILDGYAYTPKISTEVSENKKNHLQVYPNPFADKLKILAPIRNYSIRLLNVFGDELLRFDNLIGNADIDVKALPAGIYLLTIESGTFYDTQKLIKQF
jgi:hypothetical protein